MQLRKWEIGAILAVLALASFLRFFRIGEKSLWLDEAASLMRTRDSFSDMISQVKESDGHPPLYYTLLFVWRRATGDSETSIRSLSASFGIGSVALVWLIGRTALGPTPGLVAASLQALSVFQIYFSQETRFHALAVMLTLLSTFLVVRLAADPGRKSVAVGLGIVTTLGFYTAYYYLFVWLWQCAYLLLRHRSRRTLVAWGYASLLAVVLYAPWAWVPLYKARMFAGLPPMSSGYVFGGWVIPRSLADYVGGYCWIGADAAACVGLCALGLVAVGLSGLSLATQGKKERDALWLFALGFAGPFLCLAVFPMTPHIFESKHLVMASPFLCLLCVGLVTGDSHRAVSERLDSARRAVRGALLACVGAVNIVGLSFYYGAGSEKENWRDLAGKVQCELRPGDVICLDPFYLMEPFLYYFLGPSHELPYGLVRSKDLGDYYWGTGAAAAVYGVACQDVRIYGENSTVNTRGAIVAAGRKARRMWIVEDISNVSIPGLELQTDDARSTRRWLNENFIDTGEGGMYPGFSGELRLALLVKKAGTK